MIKKISRIVCFAFIAIFAAGITLGGVNGVYAAERTTVLINENFEGSSLDSKKWLFDFTGEPTISMPSAEEIDSYLTFNANLEGYLLGTKDKLTDIEYVQFDFLQPAGKWEGVYFAPNNTDIFGKYEIPLVLTEGYLGSYGLCDLTPISGENLLWNASEGWHTVRIVPLSDSEAEIYFFERGKNTENEQAFAKATFKSSAYSFKSAYVLFACEGGGRFDIDNLKIKASGTEISESFSSREINAGLAEYRKNNAATYSIISNEYLAVKAPAAGDGIVYKTPVAREESVIASLDCLDVGFSIDFSAAGSDEIAFAFGMGENHDYKKGSYACIADEQGVSVVKITENGSESFIPKTHYAADLQTGKLTLRFVANKDGEFSVYANDALLAAGVSQDEYFYAGYFGFVATKKNEGLIKIDDLSVKTISYRVPVTKSVTHNFSNDYFGNEGYEDFIMNNGDGKISVSDGKLAFEGCSDSSYFGSAHEYDDFVLDYKICNIYASDKDNDKTATARNKWIGLDLGKKEKRETDYGTNVMFFFEITPTEEYGTLKVWTREGSSADKEEIASNMIEHAKIPSSLFKDVSYDGKLKTESAVREKDAVCVRWVAENGTLRLYLKKASDIGFTLYYTINGVETTGYAALTCTGYTYMKLDDFSMANTSGLYVCADNYVPETITKTETNTIYDRSNTDENWREEVKANSASGCGAAIGSEIVVPLLAALFACIVKIVADKRRKSK